MIYILPLRLDRTVPALPVNRFLNEWSSPITFAKASVRQ